MKPLLVLSAGVIMATVLIEVGNGGGFFRPYFGDIPATVGVLLASAAGGGAMWFLNVRRWFSVHQSGRGWRGFVASAFVATLLAAVAIGVDFTVGIEVANVPPPWSLAFYPVMAFVAEVVFHLLPLALLLAAASALRVSKEVSVWSAMALSSLIEPTFQIAGDSAGWLAAYVWLQVWAVNATQLYVFRRFGFVSMYLVRIVYYLHWHIVWGALRLTV
ncbi:MAG: hypothetical protein JNK07_02010 [Alphaproteobacteria bacterium]|nr:hypothetical protein [Alphaproteobacteria bacterium]